ncbi:hypothetical protein NQ314_020267 [Rhamnusium bicolor]|uniref:Trehalase n=1 Tax=Rhamnusium bicolor TaxID=1586634 RepID=A0AAV8WNJ1_9CUCU|nr:hypothetical protein NQ314_020267 [Rhamnusium bicolor]
MLTAIFSYSVRSETMQSCDSLIYCQGELLDTIQTSGIFDDSKTFVDMIQVNALNKTLENFDQLMIDTNNNPTKEELKQFVENNFVAEGELDEWSPTDYKSNPAFLKKIDDIVVRDFARNLVSIWPDLARKVKNTVSENPDRHSLIPVPNGFIVPGGALQGAVLLGLVLDSERVYYLNRSQPPLLSLMVSLYIDATKNLEWLRENIETIEDELKWWLTNRVTVVERDGVKYSLAHYASESGTPRPESYHEDVRTCATFESENDKVMLS